MAPNSKRAPSLEDVREWPPQVVARLFNLVKPHPVLYDNTHDQWKNKTHKGRLWTQIAKDLDPYLSSRRCRDRFVNARRRVATDIRRQMAVDPSAVNTDLMWLLDTEDEKQDTTSTATTAVTDHNRNSMSPPTQVPMIALRNNDDGEDGHATDGDTFDLEKHLKSLDTSAQRPTKRLSSDSINSSTGSVEHRDAASPAKRPRKSPNPKKFESPPNSAMCPESPPLLNFNDLMVPNIDFVEAMNAIQAAMQETAVNEECRIAGRQVELDLKKLNATDRIMARLEIDFILSKYIKRDIDTRDGRLSN